MSFERARHPDQKAHRRSAIVQAATELFDEVGLVSSSLSEIARRAGSSKANVYRYFESREHIYLAILEREYAQVAKTIERRLDALVGSDDAEGVAEAIADALADQPRLVHLTSLVGSVLEQNVSVDAIRAFKREVVVALLRYATSLNRAMPSLSPAQCQRAVHYIAAQASGIYHASHPADAVRTVLEEPEFAWARFDFRSQLAEHARVVLAGLKHESR
ncbi:MAG: TetR family transcriptional regulator [Myxococcota bacterium]